MYNKNFKKIFSTICILILVLFILNCGEKKTTSEVKFGTLGIITELPVFVAKEKGFFKEEGLDVQIEKLGSSNLICEAVLSDSIQFGWAGVPQIFGIEQNKAGTFKFFASNLNTFDNPLDYYLVQKESEIKNLADLKGKKVGCFPGSSMLFLTKLELSNYLDSEKDIEIIQLPPSTQIQALDSGQVDVLYTLEPFASLAISKIGAKVIEKAGLNRYVINPFPGGLAILSSKFSKDNPTLIKSVERAINKAIDFIREDNIKAREILPKYTPVSVELANSLVLVDFWKSDELQVEKIQGLADKLFNGGALFKKVEVSKMILK